MTLETFLNSHFSNKKTVKTSNGVQTICPCHKNGQEENPSLDITEKNGTILMHCKTCGATGINVCKVLSIPPAQMGGSAIQQPKTEYIKQKCTATFYYHDTEGNVIYRKDRMEPSLSGKRKDFYFRRPNGKGGWIDKLGDTPHQLYGLHLLKDQTEIIITEGEAKADFWRENGFAATTMGGGLKLKDYKSLPDDILKSKLADMWPPHFSEALKGKRIILNPDRDEPGQISYGLLKLILADVASELLVIHNPKGCNDIIDAKAKWLKEKRDIAYEVTNLALNPKPIDEPEDLDFGQEILDVGSLLETEPPPRDFILKDCFEMGDKILIVGAPKMKKSFFAQQMGFCLAAGVPFLGWSVPRTRKVLLVQYENKDDHFHRRARYIASGLSVGIECLGGRFKVIHGKGKDVPLASIESIAIAGKYEVIIFDPLYKLIMGDENKAEDMKPILATFDRIAHNSGAAVVYVHHDAKGNPGERGTRDRGAGSNVLIRDIDHGFMLSAHEQGQGYYVVESLGRNNPDEAKFTAQWDNGIFFRNEEIEPSQNNSKTRKASKQPKVLEAYLSDTTQSYSDVAKKVGCSKTYVHSIVTEYLKNQDDGIS